jgi:hypothetical protein
VSYEAAVNPTGGDDVALAKSFIIACEGPILNWYSLLPPHSICSWIDLKTKLIQAFQVFYETSAKPLDLYSCKQKDREPLQNFVRRFMQQKSQILGTNDKTTIQSLIKGITLGLTASHLTRKEPQSIGELFDKLEQYIMSDEDHRRRVAEQNQDKAIEEQDGGPNSKPHETSIMLKIPHRSSTKIIGQAQEGGFHQEEEEEEEEHEEDLRKSKIMIQEIHTFTVDITGGA